MVSEEEPVVYMTTDISPEGLMAIYKALGAQLPEGNIAVKISTGKTGSNYLRPELIGGLVQAVGGTIVECNTVCGGERASTAYHMQLTEDYGYTAIADVDIMDADGSMTLPVTGGTGGSMWGGDQNAFLESMAEAGKSVADYMNGNMLYINVMNRLSVDRDCDGSPR